MNWIFCNIWASSRGRLKQLPFFSTSSAWFVYLQHHVCFKLIKTRADYLDFTFQTVRTVARNGRSTDLKIKQKPLLPSPRQRDPTCTNAAEWETHPAPKWMRALLGSLCWCPVLCVTRSQDMAWGQVWGTAQDRTALHRTACTHHLWSSEASKVSSIFFCLIFYSCCHLPSVWCQREDLIFTVFWQTGDILL